MLAKSCSHAPKPSRGDCLVTVKALDRNKNKPAVVPANALSWSGFDCIASKCAAQAGAIAPSMSEFAKDLDTDTEIQVELARAISTVTWERTLKRSSFER